MPTRRPNAWRYLTTLLAITVLTAPALAADAKKTAKTEPVKRQMLFKIFAPIMRNLGSQNLQKASVVSGPVAMKMNNNKKPGKQWKVRLGQSEFKVTIEDSTNLKLKDALAYAELIPVAYRRALEVVSEDKKAGLAFYKTLGGAAAHGGQSYLNMIPLKPDRAASVIVHEAGHILEQRARNTDKEILKKWAVAIKADNIDVSNYGNKVAHEDLAEFARLYAFCVDYAAGRGMKNELKKLSPKRFELWEQMLKLSKALPILHLDVEFNPLGGPLHEGKGNSDDAKVKFISGPKKVQMRQYDRSKNKVVTIHAKQWLASLGDTKFKITFEDTEMKLKLKDAVKLVETLPPPYRAGLAATSEKGETGLTIYKGGCAYGVPDRIGMGGHNLSATTLAHECGHTIDQKAREYDKDIMNKWGLAKIRDGVSVSGYGNGPIHEDHAEFARLYAISLAHSPKYLAKLQSLSPTRYAVWEKMLMLTGGMNPSDAADAPNFDFNAELKKHTQLREKMAPNLKKVSETIKALQSSTGK